jgi:hypothetical protein
MNPDDSCPGMAHFAGTGPDGETCNTCKHFAGWKRKYKERAQALGPGRCRQFIKLTRAATGRRRVPRLIIPLGTPACRHHVLVPDRWEWRELR